MLPQDLPRGHVETGLLRAVARGNAVHATTYRLVEAEAGRRVGAGLIAEDLESELPDILSALHGEQQ